MIKNELYDGEGNLIESVEIPYTQSEIELHLANYRYARETGGTSLNGVTIQTARDSRGDLIAARIKATEDANYEVDWKTDAGFVTLNAPTILAIADAVESHVQKCFRAENSVLSQIGSYTTPEEVEAAFDTAYDAL